MLGWQISVYRNKNESGKPVNGTLASWQAGLDGLDWIDGLVKQKRAVLLESNCGYPEVYKAKIRDVRPVILEGPPDANGNWKTDPGDVTFDWWQGEDKFNIDLLKECDPEEWVLIEAWDES